MRSDIATEARGPPSCAILRTVGLFVFWTWKMRKNTFFAILFVLAFTASACKSLPLPSESPLTPTPLDSPLAPVGGPMPVEEEKSPMDMDAIYRFLAILDEACRATQLYVILGAVALDWIGGVLRSWREGTFDWRRMNDFYRTMIMPLGLGYFCLYVVIAYIPGMSDFISAKAQDAACAMLLLSLQKSLRENWGVVGIALFEAVKERLG